MGLFWNKKELQSCAHDQGEHLLVKLTKTKKGSSFIEGKGLLVSPLHFVLHVGHESSLFWSLHFK